MTEYFLLLVIILQFVYIVYKDVSNGKERERLQLKLMSKNLVEYKEAVEKPPKPAKKPKPSPFKNLEDVSIDKLLTAEDNI